MFAHFGPVARNQFLAGGLDWTESDKNDDQKKRPKQKLSISSKVKGPGKGPPEIIQKFCVRNWPISSAAFPMTHMEGTEQHFGPIQEQHFGPI